MNTLKIFIPFIIFIIASLITLSLSRGLLMLWQYERIVDTQGGLFIFIQGVRFDLVLMGLLLVIPAIIAPLISLFKPALSGWNLLLRIYLVLCFSSLLFIELSTPSFIDQYDLRPNHLFVEYLKYPKEVLSTLWAAYKLPLILSILITFISALFLFKKLKQVQSLENDLTLLKAFALVPVVFIICLAMARSTLDHRAVNPSTVAFSADPLINMMSFSSTYSVLYAISEMRSENTGKQPYGIMPIEQATQLVKDNMRVDKKDFINNEIPTLHKQTAYIQRDKPLNLVIILEESLGAEYVGSLGGKKLTPELDKLNKQGIWFENLYATGTRSVRGIEAVVTGFTPTPSRSVVKLSKSQTGFFSLARLLAKQNYHTSFIYGGEAHFDNMKRFFANNGFNKIVDENDYENPIFYGSWGASDEDLFNKAHAEFNAHHQDQPFFSLVFTSSNHSPFEFPDGRIDIDGDNKHTVDNAVKYADYALGQYIEKARQSDYWENTVFLIVADHSDKVYGSEPVPIKHFRIPALILGADIQPLHYLPVASQIDLMPTLLSLMGINSEHPAIGHDLAKNIIEKDTNITGRAIMQFNTSQAYMQGNRVAILQKNKAISEYIYKDQSLHATELNDQELKDKAMAHANWTINAYNKALYRLPETETK